MSVTVHIDIRVSAAVLLHPRHTQDSSFVNRTAQPEYTIEDSDRVLSLPLSK